MAMEKNTLSLVGSHLERSFEWLLTSGLRIILILVLALIAIKFAEVLSTKTISLFVRSKQNGELKKRAETLGSFIRYILVIAVGLISAMMILRQLGIDIGPILAGAGVAGLAVGFGAQSLVRDWLSGFFIMMEDQYRVGDVIEAAGKSGVVEQINLRITILRDVNGNVYYLRNGLIDTVTNMTKEYSGHVFSIAVGYGEDMDQVTQAIKQVDEGLRVDPEYKEDILKPLEVLGLDQFGESSVTIKARTTTRPGKQWRVGREFNRRLKDKFDKLGIAMPGQPKKEPKT